MSLFGDLHQLSEGLKLVEDLTQSTKDLANVCKQLNINIEKLIVVFEQQNQQLSKTNNKK